MRRFIYIVISRGTDGESLPRKTFKLMAGKIHTAIEGECGLVHLTARPSIEGGRGFGVNGYVPEKTLLDTKLLNSKLIFPLTSMV